MIVPELLLVLFRPGTTLVRSGLGTFFVSELEHAIRRTESLCVAHGGSWGVVRERERTADEHRSVPSTCSLHPTGRASGDRPSIHATANWPWNSKNQPRLWQCCSAGHLRSYPPTAAVVVGLNREDVEWAKYTSNNEGLWHGAEAAML